MKMKHYFWLLATSFMSMPLFADDVAVEEVKTKGLRYVAYFLAMAVSVYAGTTAQSKAASVALEGIARNPSAKEKIQTPMILSLALMESLVIFTLISIFLA